MRGDHRQVVRPVASWTCEAQNLSGEIKEGVSEYGEEEEKDPRGAESRHRKATALCEYGSEDDRQTPLCIFGKSIEGGGTHLGRDDPKGAGTADLYAEKQDPQRG